MKKIETYGSIKDGKLTISFRDKFLQAIADFNDCRIKLTVHKLYKKRSVNQNDYYWAVIVNEYIDGYLDIWGEKIDINQAHEMLKYYCNYKEVVNRITGEISRLPLSTKELTTVEYEEYCIACRNWIKEFFNRSVPLPNEQSEMNFNL